MPVPSPSLSTPSLADDCAFFQGITFGEAPFFIRGDSGKGFEGFDKPTVRSGNTNWSLWPGASVGNNQLNSRQPVLTIDVGPPYGSYGSLASAVAALVTACSTEGSTEYPLWVQLPGLPFVCTYARVLKTNFPWDLTADLGGLLQGGSIQFECTDPYLYSAPTISTSIGLPGPVSGFTPPVTFPLSFGSGSGSNTATVTNYGDVTCWPTLVITGPCTNPAIVNNSINGTPTISTTVTLNAGDELWIDCRLGAITFYPSGSTVGSPLQYVLQSGSEYFGLPPGDSILSFNSGDDAPVAGTVAVWNASAYDGLL